jgi:uncharacterized protein DUF6714
MNKNKIRSVIEKAFEGVTLEDGTSILQTDVIDNFGEGYTDEEFDALAKRDICNDWKQIPSTDLDKLHTAHLDDKGFRYYIPALMCRLLDTYPLDVLDPGTMREIGTLSSLYPTNPSPQHKGYKEYIISRYEHLDLQQRQAIALFLKWLPELVELKTHDQTVIERALRNYWKDFL